MSPGAAEMEDAKPVLAAVPDDGGAMESRFADLCKTGLGLDESKARQARMLFCEIKPILQAYTSAIGTGSLEEVERLWSGLVLYCVKKLSEGNIKHEVQDGGFTLPRILRAAKLNVVDFFKEMPQFLLKVGHLIGRLYGSDWEKRLEVKESQANFVHLKILSGFYKRVYEEFFLPGDARSAKHASVSTCTGYISDYHRFGWLLFLALRIHAFGRFKDIVTSTNGIVSILAILILHVPIRFRKFSVLDSSHLVKRTDKGPDLVASLCKIYETSEDELKRMMEKANSLIVDILKKEPRPAPGYKTENLEHFDLDGLTYFEDLMEEKSLSSSLVKLEKDYDDAICLRGELDERMFANDEDSLIGTGSLSGGAINMCSTKRKLDALASPAKSITSPLSPPRTPASPLNGSLHGNAKMAHTPVTTAMTTAKWLRNVISPLPSKPSAELERFLSSCDKDVSGDVTRRANIILEAIFPNSSFGERCIAGSLQSASLMDNIWAEQRKLEGMKLYYRVLEAMCRAESQIFNGNNLTSLLTNERFHRCMLACSAELVLATHKTVTMMFPAVLEKTGITAFDLSKVIESFVRHEETLPRELKRHLNSLEERLLESMAWEKGSSMYNSLIVARPSLSAEINRLGLLAEPMPSLDAIAMLHNISTAALPLLPVSKSETSPDQNGEARSPKRVCTEYRSVLVERNSFTSPVKDRLLTFSSLKSKLPLLQSAFASPTRPNPAAGGETCAETGISIFFNKITKLAAIRIRSLCERLQLCQPVVEHVYCLIQQILNHRTALFFNRHIDQIILCSLYGVAKISQLNVTFKEIIYSYRKQPQCKPQVFRSVFVDWPSTSCNGRTGQEHVDIITFYNEAFIPSVKPLLVDLGPAGPALRHSRLPEDGCNTDGHSPGSPRLPPFPSLPDMSPKKVSATHNVYVSPLRSSKMDALLSPSSKSYYACVGESTHAYQSPSKDLTAINNRLNCGRKVSGRLNFDSIVSDSLVAGSLGGPQNGCSAASCTIDATLNPVKREHPDP
uniref:Retinoblastoma-related protein n=2 Tax=Anthurium amnicola TaxID=1678845 RepID=A0A1D1ZL71_9ARAE